MQKKLSNWWEYHKVQLILLLIVLILVALVIATFFPGDKTEILMGEMINQYESEEWTTQFEDELLLYLGGNPEKEEVFLETSLQMDLEKMDTDTEDALAKITTYVYAHELDFMIVDANVADYYIELNAFAPLDELLSTENYELLADYMYQVDGVSYGIRLSDTGFEKTAALCMDDPVLCIVSGSEHKEAAVGLIYYIFEVDE